MVNKVIQAGEVSSQTGESGFCLPDLGKDGRGEHSRTRYQPAGMFNPPGMGVA